MAPAQAQAQAAPTYRRLAVVKMPSRAAPRPPARKPMGAPPPRPPPPARVRPRVLILRRHRRRHRRQPRQRLPNPRRPHQRQRGRQRPRRPAATSLRTKTVINFPIARRPRRAPLRMAGAMRPIQRPASCETARFAERIASFRPTRLVFLTIAFSRRALEPRSLRALRLPAVDKRSQRFYDRACLRNIFFGRWCHQTPSHALAP